MAYPSIIVIGADAWCVYSVNLRLICRTLLELMVWRQEVPGQSELLPKPVLFQTQKAARRTRNSPADMLALLWLHPGRPPADLELLNYSHKTTEFK